MKSIKKLYLSWNRRFLQIIILRQLRLIKLIQTNTIIQSELDINNGMVFEVSNGFLFVAEQTKKRLLQHLNAFVARVAVTWVWSRHRLRFRLGFWAFGFVFTLHWFHVHHALRVFIVGLRFILVFFAQLAVVCVIQQYFYGPE